MENENKQDDRRNEIIFTQKFRAGKRRTYFFDVKKTRANDYFLTITESKKRMDGEGYDRHKIFLYKEDMNKFLELMTSTINHIKTELMPEYDFDEFARREEEYKASQSEHSEFPSNHRAPEKDAEIPEEKKKNTDDDDMKW